VSLEVPLGDWGLRGKVAIVTGGGAAGDGIGNGRACRRSRPSTVSKSAVIGLTKATAVDHGKEGIRVNCVAPGPVRDSR
jgi:hypothetical protein